MKTTYLYTREIQPRLKGVHLISDNAIDRIKRYAPVVIENSMKLPALGFVSFMAETYSFLNKPENKYINEAKSFKYYFLLKYCSLSFLSFYF